MTKNFTLEVQALVPESAFLDPCELVGDSKLIDASNSGRRISTRLQQEGKSEVPVGKQPLQHHTNLEQGVNRTNFRQTNKPRVVANHNKTVVVAPPLRSTRTLEKRNQSTNVKNLVLSAPIMKSLSCQPTTTRGVAETIAPRKRFHFTTKKRRTSLFRFKRQTFATQEQLRTSIAQPLQRYIGNGGNMWDRHSKRKTDDIESSSSSSGISLEMDPEKTPLTYSIDYDGEVSDDEEIDGSVEEDEDKCDESEEEDDDQFESQIHESFPESPKECSDESFRWTFSVSRYTSHHSDGFDRWSDEIWNLKDFDKLHPERANLGTGKFGVVCARFDTMHRRVVALKALNKAKLLSRTCSTKLLQREIEIHSRLSHENIVQLYGYFHEIDTAYLVLELAPEGELYNTYLRKQKGIKMRIAAAFTLDLTSALMYLKRHHIVHRDIKPENLLLFPQMSSLSGKRIGQKLKLCDFGWAVHAPAPCHNMRRTLCGTPEYVPPEMLEYEDGQGYDSDDEDSESDSNVTKRYYIGDDKRCRKLKYLSTGKLKSYDACHVDSWALGVLAYEMVLGKTPFYLSAKEKKRVMEDCGYPLEQESTFELIRQFMHVPKIDFSSGNLHESTTYEELSVFAAFVNAHMMRKPTLRQSIKNAIAHPWLNMGDT